MDEATQFSTQPWVDRFLNDLQQGNAQPIESLLPNDPVQRLQCLKAFISADIRAKFSSGATIDCADYLATYPEIDSEWLTRFVDSLAPSDHSELFGGTQDPAASNAIPPDSVFHPKDWRSGQTLGQFTIVSKIGEGAHGTVFLANDTQLNRMVAIKVSPDSGIEGRILARLQHPNIVKIHSQFVTENYRCLVMPFIAGPTLIDLLKQEPYRDAKHWTSKKLADWISEFASDRNRTCLEGLLPPHEGSTNGIANEPNKAGSYTETISQWILSIAHALQHAHARGVLHRDIKPSNVIIDESGAPMLMDFNVAAFEEERSDSDRASFGGTLSYMSPEHTRAFETATGEEEVDTRSDLFSLGVVFVELLTGHKHWSNPDELSSLLSSHSVASRLKPIILKCVQPKPDDRYQGAQELIHDLEAWFSDKPLLHARPTNRFMAISDWARRYRRVLVIGASVVFLFLGLIGLANLRTVSVLNECRELTDAAEVLLREGQFVEAFNTIGDAKGMLASAPAAQLLHPANYELLVQRWDRLLTQGKATRLDSHLEALRRNRLTGASATQSSARASDFASESLAEYRLLTDDDWESRRPFASLNTQERRRISQQLSEIVLLLGLQRKQMTETQLEKWRLVRSRLPAEYRDAIAFNLCGEVHESVDVDKLPESEEEFENYLLGIVLLDRGELPAARHRFQKSRLSAIRSSQFRYWNFYWEALVCQELGKSDEAAVLYGACLGQDPTFIWPYLNLCLLHVDNNQLDTARRLIDEAVGVDPNSGLAHETRAAVCIKQQDYSAARESLRAAERIGFDSQQLSRFRTICESK